MPRDTVVPPKTSRDSGQNPTPVTPKPVPGRRERRKEATRRELIRAGRALFGERGLYESRIEDLTSRAGIAKGTIYGYFANKEDLIRAVEEAGLAELLLHVRTRATGSRTRRELVQRVIRAHLEFFRANRDLATLFHQVQGMLKFNRLEWLPLRAGLEGYVRELAGLLAGPGLVTARSQSRSREAAELLFGGVFGIASLAASLGNPAPKPARTERLVESMVALIMEHGAAWPNG